MKRRLCWTLLLLLAAQALFAQSTGKKRRPLPYEYGRVSMQADPAHATMPPAVFEHWIHRQKFTCRVCHVDVGFAMKPNASNVKKADNERGYFCGSCHNGHLVSDGRAIFAACGKLNSEADASRCDRCHFEGRAPRSAYDFAEFVKTVPRERFGNGIDWQQAEELKLIRPADSVPGVSIKRKEMHPENDFSLSAKTGGIPNIIFSHRKHTVWNGCELCHPEIFVGVKRGASRYSMVTIFEGGSCGACHNTVAFPLTDCQRCHTKPVQ